MAYINCVSCFHFARLCFYLYFLLSLLSEPVLASLALLLPLAVIVVFKLLARIGALLGHHVAACCPPWLLAACCLLLAAGCWLLAAGCLGERVPVLPARPAGEGFPISCPGGVG